MEFRKLWGRLSTLLVCLGLGLIACGDPTPTPMAPSSAASAIPITTPTAVPAAPTTLIASDSTATTTLPAQFHNLPASARLDSENMTIGSPQARLTLIKYTDLRCPACKNNFDQTEQLLIGQYVNTGKIKLLLRTYPIIDRLLGDNDSQLGGQALLCAADQQRAWDYQDLAYNNFVGKVSGKLTPSYLKGLAQALQLNSSQFESCLDSGKYRQSVLDQAAQGEQLGVAGTPSFVISYMGKTDLVKGNTFEVLKAEIGRVLSLFGV